MHFPEQQETHAVHAETSPSSVNATDSESNAPLDIADELAEKQSERSDGKRELKEADCYEILGYSWPLWKKWTYLAAVAFVQVSMNFNTSVYPAAVKPLSEAFNISEQHARTGQMAYLVTYSIGCELWAPWSEEFGRWPILQLSMFLINIWQLPAALAPNWGSLVVARALGGISTAGGSVTLGLIADIYESETQQFPLAFIVLSSCIGTSIGGVIGGPIARFLDWQWFFWIQLIFGAVTQVIIFFMPESRSTIIMDKEAKRRRKSGEDPNIYGPNELKVPRISFKEAGKIWMRPFHMLLREPIVLCLSLLSGFSDALIFTFLESFAIVYEQGWGFGTLGQAWAVIPINAAYFIAYFSYFPWFMRDEKLRLRHGDAAIPPERRLKWLLFLAPLEPIGLFGFAWTTFAAGDARNVHWIASMIFSACVGIANYAIYLSSVDYMVASYGVYSASATGGNAFARDLLAGISAMYATPMYSNIGDEWHVQYASTILACLSCLVVIPIYIFYWKGPQIRANSKFAATLAADRSENNGRRVSQISAEPDPGVSGYECM
ncbi:MFS multidrug transporter [Aspergillus nomiae NRRL 13137]|uniref:MFS multidrug transporter n=1 Tax=Aspergillus nomiae NRRL (strain ATCC 15546 / NRRL 13137 / CBS 260.88 / M93) TaxID=1509407 RepID=A0A0L1JCI2_ASPN3|nr:MFS multidrug transporter [Aspergillus nomiae NRRL 13137]KNG89427.1 MFS multidrug transporter [Aspergillus nomiae NRRL 13137]